MRYAVVIPGHIGPVVYLWSSMRMAFHFVAGCAANGLMADCSVWERGEGGAWEVFHA